MCVCVLAARIELFFGFAWVFVCLFFKVRQLYHTTSPCVTHTGSSDHLPQLIVSNKKEISSMRPRAYVRVGFQSDRRTATKCRWTTTIPKKTKTKKMCLRKLSLWHNSLSGQNRIGEKRANETTKRNPYVLHTKNVAPKVSVRAVVGTKNQSSKDGPFERSPSLSRHSHSLYSLFR